MGTSPSLPLFIGANPVPCFSPVPWACSFRGHVLIEFVKEAMWPGGQELLIALEAFRKPGVTVAEWPRGC